MSDTEKQAANRAELEADLAALRRQGVKTFKGSGIDVEFFPAAPAELKEPQKKLAEDDLCPCGHHVARDHTNGFCIHNCTNCDPEAKGQQQREMPA